MKSLKTTENTEGREDFSKKKSRKPDLCRLSFFLLSVPSVPSVVNLPPP